LRPRYSRIGVTFFASLAARLVRRDRAARHPSLRLDEAAGDLRGADAPVIDLGMCFPTYFTPVVEVVSA